MNSKLEYKADGTLVAYIPFWRYMFFGFFFAVGFVLCIIGFTRLYRELPTGFYQHWDKAANVALIVFILAMAMLLWGYWIMKGGYKKVQFELDSFHVRYLKNGIRGGILFSEQEVSVSLSDITAVELWPNALGGGEITARTATQTHSIRLILATDELQVCYRALQEAIQSRQLTLTTNK